eukprot:scaffold1696_cov258-Pinguiococcus_pyrenoidosus.AAC.36
MRVCELACESFRPVRIFHVFPTGLTIDSLILHLAEDEENLVQIVLVPPPPRPSADLRWDGLVGDACRYAIECRHVGSGVQDAYPLVVRDHGQGAEVARASAVHEEAGPDELVRRQPLALHELQHLDRHVVLAMLPRSVNERAAGDDVRPSPRCDHLLEQRPRGVEPAGLSAPVDQGRPDHDVGRQAILLQLAKQSIGRLEVLSLHGAVNHVPVREEVGRHLVGLHRGEVLQGGVQVALL